MSVKNINQLFAEFGAQIPVLNELPASLPEGAPVLVIEGDAVKLYVGDSTNNPVIPKAATDAVTPEVTPQNASAGDFFEFMGRTYGVVQSATGRLWLDRNLGAASVASWLEDKNALGDLYQYGRFADGHQLRNQDTTTTLAAGNNATTHKFILASGDWQSISGETRWQPNTRLNLPAPMGWRIPTENEWNQEIATWSGFNTNGAFTNNPLKLPAGGYKNGQGDFFTPNSGVYWTCTYQGTLGHAKAVNIRNSASGTSIVENFQMTAGLMVRLIKEE
jgi:hypothetical protein